MAWLLAFAGLVATAGPGASEPSPAPNPAVDAAIAGLSDDPPIYSDPKAPLALSGSGTTQVLAAIAAARIPMFVAVMPGSAGKAKEAARRLKAGLGHPGTYVAVSGEAYEAVSDTVDVTGLMQKAFAAERTKGTAAVLVRFIDLAAARARGAAAEPPAETPWARIALVALLIAAAIAIYAVAMRAAPGRGDRPASREQPG